MTEYPYLFFAELYASLAIEVLKRLKIGSYVADEAYQSLLDARGTLLSGMREIEARNDVGALASPQTGLKQR